MRPLFLFSTAFLFSIQACNTSAKIVEYPLSELVLQHDIIVRGKLEKIRKFSDGTFVYAKGLIRVAQTIFGDVKPGDELTLKWTYDPDSIPSGDWAIDAYDEKIWMLVRQGHGEYAASYQSSQELEELPQIESNLRNPLMLRFADSHTSPARPFTVSLIYRNATNSTMTLPKLEARNDKLLLPPTASLDLCGDVAHGTSNKTIAPNAGKIEHASGEVVVLPPGSTTSTVINLEKLFPIQNATVYSLLWTNNGLKSNYLAIATFPNAYDWYYPDLIYADNPKPLWLRLHNKLAVWPGNAMFLSKLAGLVFSFVGFLYLGWKALRRVLCRRRKTLA